MADRISYRLPHQNGNGVIRHARSILIQARELQWSRTPRRHTRANTKLTFISCLGLRVKQFHVPAMIQ